MTKDTPTAGSPPVAQNPASASADGDLYRNFLEDLTEWVCRFQPDGTILYVNGAFCRFFGKTEAELVGHRWQPSAVPEDVPLIETRLRQLSPAQPVVVIENRVIGADGAVHWGQFINRAFFDPQGQLLTMQSVGRDITERKLQELKFQQLAREQNAILASPLVGIVKVSHGITVWANDAFAAMLGYGVDEIVGQPSRMRYVSDADYERCVREAFPVVVQGGTFTAQMQQRAKDGSVGWYEFTARMLDAETATVIGTMVNIGERKLAEAELADYQESLEHLVAQRTAELVQARDEANAAREQALQALQAAEAGLRAKSIFLSTMSHEMRTPLNGIVGMAQLLRRQTADTRQARQLDQVLASSSRLLSLIESLLDLARIQSGGWVPEDQRLELEVLLAQSLALTRARVGGKPLMVDLVLDEALRGQDLRGDAERLAQVLLHLTDNAIKFSESGQIHLRCQLEQADIDTVLVRFEVQDPGCGIALEDQARIFLLEQSDGSSTRRHGGSGLGLALSKGLVEGMGGRLGVVSAPGAGSTFWFTLPLRRAPATGR